MDMTNTEKKLHITDLGCIRHHKPLFTKLSFQLKASDLLLVEGPNGSGKSSLLRLLTGISSPSEGEIYWQGNKIQHVQAEYRSNLHYIGHANGIKLGLTVIEN